MLSGRPTRTGWLFAFLLGVILIAGCGQKGDLYLPDDQQSALPVSPYAA